MLPVYQFVGHRYFCPPPLSVGIPGWKGCVAKPPTCWPILIFSPALKHCGPPNCRGYAANMPICGPILILSPALKYWGPLGRQGFCSQTADLWATSDFLPCREAFGTH